MPKLRGPILSLGATGGLTRLFSLARRMGRNIIEKKPIPTDAKSPAQLFYRHMFTKCVDLWHTLSEAERQEWESLARPRHMTGYAWYISQCLRPNPGIYLPLQGGTMSGNIDMDKNRLLKLPNPTDDQEAAHKKYVDDLAPGLHALSHEKDGADEIDVEDLSGLLVEDQHVLDAEVNALIAIHAALITGVHGAGDSILATTLNIAQHAALPNVHHTPPTPGAVLIVAETEVFSGIAPTAWTDLNLSGTIGANVALVLLKVAVSGDTYVAVRKNGDTDEFYLDGVTLPSGCAFANFPDVDPDHRVLIVATDTSGIIEWKSRYNRTITIDTIAYIK